jgi:IclR family acetate operon transcriptional repressor
MLFMVMKSVDRTLSLFELFAEQGVPLTLSEISRLLGMPVSTCHNLMRSLQAAGYLYEVSGKSFYPTGRWLEKARVISGNDPSRIKIQPHLEMLRDQTAETILFSKQAGDKLVYLEVLEGTHNIRYSANAGDLKPLVNSASGKALLGALPAAEREKLVSKIKLVAVTTATITDKAKLLRDLEQGIERGWFLTRGEGVIDVMSIATSINIGGGTYAIAIAGPIHRLEPNVKALALKLVTRCQKIAASAR